MNKHRLNMNFLNVIILSAFIFTTNAVRAEEKTVTQNETNSSHYLIGANDVLNIFVWKEADLTQDIIVMADGRITFPMIGEVMAKDLTVIELKNIITEKLKNFISNPEVTVIVKESRSRMIYTIGKVNKPGPYQMQPDMTVLQALSTAGGFTEWADTKSIMIVRRAKNNEVMFRFNYQEFISGKDLKQNIVLEPNDTIVVP
jgi:polysaccharide export outer membrane protein